MSDSTGRQLSWNAQNQLTQLKMPSLTAQFSYDPQGRRVSYTKGSLSKSYFLHGLDVLSDGTSKFLHGAGIDEPLQVDSATSSQSYLQDHLGSMSQLMDASNGASKLRYDYQSYGTLEAGLTNSSLTNPYTYTGREDDGTGLMYYRARYYDPELEVLISQDLLGDAQRYVKGNPLRFIDPWGLYTVNLIDPNNMDQSYRNISLGKAEQLGGETYLINPFTIDSIVAGIIRLHNGEKPTDLNIIAHGGPEHIGSMFESNLSSLQGLVSNAPVRITLYSCNTGYGQNNIAKTLSAIFPNATVYAPNAEWRPGYGTDLFSPTVDAENGLSTFGIAVPNGWFGLGFQEFKNGVQK